MSVSNAAVREYLSESTRAAGKCLGTVGNDLSGRFGSYPDEYFSATVAADSLGSDLHGSACPSDSHFDFYHFTEDGIDYGHIDLHVPALGIHYANSSRCTTWLNAKHTVGTYPSWPVGPRRGWSYHPGRGNTMPTVDVAGTAADGSHPLDNTTQEDDMVDLLCTTSTQHFGEGQRFVLTPQGPLRCLAAGEYGLHSAAGVPSVDVPGETLELLLGSLGMWEYASTGTLTPGPLTGRILGGQSGFDSSGNPLVAFPKVAGVTSSSGSAPDLSPVLAAIDGVPAQVRAAFTSNPLK